MLSSLGLELAHSLKGDLLDDAGPLVRLPMTEKSLAVAPFANDAFELVPLHRHRREGSQLRGGLGDRTIGPLTSSTYTKLIGYSEDNDTIEIIPRNNKILKLYINYNLFSF